MIFLGLVIVVLIIGGVGWFALNSYCVEQRETALEAEADTMQRHLTTDEVSEEFAHEVVPADQRARDEGAV